MARDDDIRRGTRKLEKEAGRVETNRAKRINSLTEKMSNLIEEENEKRLQVSTEISSLTKQQQKAMKQLEMMRSEFTTETTSAFNRVIKGLGNAMESFAVGIKNITTDTAKASAEAVRQYGRAIGEDISVNKVNTVAMALSTATPLFGYFAAKFMETDVFQDTAQRIKGRIGDAVQQGLSSIANIFRKKPEKGEVESEELSAITFDLEEIKTKLDKDLPTMQKGGVVTKGGVVKVHSAEVITPVDKLLGKMESVSEKARMDERRSLVRTFIDALKEAELPTGEKWQERMVKAINELKVALIGTTSRLRIAFQRTILEHPSFRLMLIAGDALRSAIFSPLKYLFGIRGGYSGKARSAMSSGNMFQNIANLLAIIYSDGMLKLDTIILNLQKMFEFQTGGAEALEATEETYTMFGKIREFMGRPKGPKKPFGEGVLNFVTSMFGLDPGALKEAGISSIFDLAHPGKIFGTMGVTRRTLKKKISEEYVDFAELIADVKALRKMKSAQEEREGPGSPSMAENIANTSKVTEEAEQRQKKSDEKQQETLSGIHKESKQQTGFLGRVWGLWRKASKQIWSWILLGLGILKDMFFTGTNILFDLLAGIGGGLFEFMGGRFGRRKKPGKPTGKWTGKEGRIRTGLRGAGTWARGTRVGGAISGGIKFGGKALALGTAAAGAGIGLGIEGIMGAFQAEEWGVGKIAGAIGSMLGGAGEGGFGSMVWGAIKGAMLGSVIPGVGTLIGAVIGAALGLIGGKNIAKGYQAVANVVKKIVSVPFKIVKGIWSVIGKVMRIVWNIVMLPFRSMYQLVKDVWATISDKLKGAVSAAWEWVSKGLATGWANLKSIVKIPFDAISSVIDRVKEWLKAPGWMQEVINSIVNVISSLIMPIVGLVKKIKDWVVDKLSGIPLVGRILKMVYSEFTKEGGTTYQELYRKSKQIAEEAAAEKAGKPLTPPTGAPGEEVIFGDARERMNNRRKAEMRRKVEELRKYGATEGIWKLGRLQQVKVDGRWVDVSDIEGKSTLPQGAIAKTEARKRAKEMEMERLQWADFTDTLTDAVSEGNKKVTAAVVNSTNVIAQTNTNLATSRNLGGGAAEFSASSGDRSVYSIQVCDVQ